MCWPCEQTLGSSVHFKVGIRYISGRISNIDKNHGVLITTDITGGEYKVYFLTSNFYCNGEKVDAPHRMINEIIFFDAVPCIPEENEYNCKWYATCVFQGKRPTISKILPEPSTCVSGINKIFQIIENVSILNFS